jgi:steroid delta-isomerase-like uncharacterized protein
MNKKGVFFMILVGLIWLLAACQQSPQTARPEAVEGVTTVPVSDPMTPSDSTQEAIALVQAYHDAFNAYDLNGIQALITDDFVLSINFGLEENPVFNGKEPLAELVDSVKADNWQISVSDLKADGPVVLGNYSGNGDSLSELNVGMEYGTLEAVVENGRIQSLSYVNDPRFAVASTLAEKQQIEEANLALVRRFYDEYSAGNADIILEIHPETILMHYAGSSDEVPAQVLRDDLAALKEANPDLRAEIHSIYASGDMVIAELTWTTTHTGDYFGISATGKTTLHPGIVVRRLEDGLIVESWEMWDDLAFFNSLGYVPSWDELVAGSAEVAPATVSEPTPTALPEVTAATVVGIWANLNDQEGNSYLILNSDGTYQGKHGPSPEEGILVTEGTFTVADGVVTFTDATYCPAGESYESYFLTAGRIRFDVIEVCGEDKLLPENPVLQLIN